MVGPRLDLFPPRLHHSLRGISVGRAQRGRNQRKLRQSLRNLWSPSEMFTVILTTSSPFFSTSVS